MRRFIRSALFLFITVLICGCLHPVASPAAPATPVQEIPPVAVTLPPATLPTPVPHQKQVIFTVWERNSQLIVRLDGGADASEITSLLFRISNYNGQYIERTFTDATIGREYVFNYRGVVDARVVNVIGSFRDGTEQTVFITYL